jgi:hypothetical protein
MPVGIGVYVFTHSFFSFLIAEFIIAIGNSMRSGCDSALVYDTLIQLKEESEYKKFEGRAFYYARLGTSLSSILGGLLALLSLQLPFYANMASSALMLPIALALIEPQRKKLETANPLKDILKISRYCFTHPKLRWFMLFLALIRSTGITGIWAYFLYYESIGISIGYFGIIFAAFQLSAALGSRQVHAMEAKIGQRASLRILLLVAPTFIFLGLFKTPLLIPLIFLNAFLLGSAFPLMFDAMNRLIGSEVRATALSVANMTASLSFVIVSPIFGKLVDSLSLSNAFTIMGLFFIICGGFIAVKIDRAVKNATGEKPEERKEP